MTEESVVNRALGEIAELLVAKGAKVGLNEIRVALGTVYRDGYSEGRGDGLSEAEDEGYNFHEDAAEAGD